MWKMVPPKKIIIIINSPTLKHNLFLVYRSTSLNPSTEFSEIPMKGVGVHHATYQAPTVIVHQLIAPHCWYTTVINSHMNTSNSHYNLHTLSMLYWREGRIFFFLNNNLRGLPAGVHFLVCPFKVTFSQPRHHEQCVVSIDTSRH